LKGVDIDVGITMEWTTADVHALETRVRDSE
jgi:hypothetical protein